MVKEFKKSYVLKDAQLSTVSEISQRLWNELVTNDEARGGRLCLVTGEQGCGKTTLLRRLAEIFLEQETRVIWRGRTVEQIHWIPNWKERCIFWHWEGDILKMYDVRGKARIPITDEVQTATYADPMDLIENLREDKINVVYEPSVFYFSEDLKLLDVVKRETGLKIAEKLKQQPHDSTYFWFELFYALIVRLDTYWYALLMDEVDDVIPENPKALRWKLQEWLKNSIRDFRKKRINFVASTHSLADVDYRIKSKIQFFIYMRNAKVRDGSVVDPIYVQQLPVGAFIMEHGAFFGYGWVAPYKRPDMGDLMVILEPKRREEDELEEVNYIG